MIADAMILVAAAAVAAQIIRSLPPFTLSGNIPGFWPDPWGIWRIHAWASGPGMCVVVPWTAAMVVIRLRPPRPRLIRHQPGFVACLAAMAGLLMGLVRIATLHHIPMYQGPNRFQFLWPHATEWVLPAVLGSWLALLLTRKWRPEPSWVDRMGRGLGFSCVAMFLVPIGLNMFWAIKTLVAR